MAPMESQGWRKKSTVTVLYTYSYPASSSSSSSAKNAEPVSMKEGERLILIEKSNSDWWQVRRPGDKSRPFYAPATYLQEDGLSKAKKAAHQAQPGGSVSPSSPTHKHLGESQSDDCLNSPARATSRWSKAVNAELRKQRSTSMDAIMFLELLENEIKDAPAGSAADATSGPGSKASSRLKNDSLVDKLKKPRISKDLWDRRKSWAVEELQPAGPLPTHRRLPAPTEKRPALAPPLPPRSSSENHSRRSTNSGADKIADEADKAPALPPKKGHSGLVVTQQRGQQVNDNYSKVTQLRSAATPIGHKAGKRMSESLERLAQQIENQTPLSYPHPIPPPRRSSGDSMAASPPPPQLPPKISIQPKSMFKQSASSKSQSKKQEVKENYVNLLRPVTVVEVIDDIQSDESGINMSFNNPLFTEKESEVKRSTEQLGSSVDLESSIDDAASLQAVQTHRSESNLSGSELDGTYASSGEDILSSKDSLNSIPSTKSEKSRSLKQLPASPSPRHRPHRELFEGWAEYLDSGGTGRPFYYNRETRTKSWKPPRRRAASPVIRGASIEEEEFDGETSADAVRLSSSVESQQSHNDESDGHHHCRSHSQMLAVEAVVEAARNRSLPPVPPGWLENIDPYTDDVFYTNTLTGARWYTSLDSEGRIYFYEEDSNESLWALPQLHSTPGLQLEAETKGIEQGVFYPEGSKLSPKMNPGQQQKAKKSPPPQIPTISLSKWDEVRQRPSKAERNSKTRSMVLTNFSGCVEDMPVDPSSRAHEPAGNALLVAKTASLPRGTTIAPQWPTLQGGSIVSDYIASLDLRVLQQGVLQKTKLTENGKKIRKNWSSSWVVLTDVFLLIFKESSNKTSNASSSASTANKPELCVDLNGATIEWASSKSSRKGVFQVSTLLGVQLLLQDEDETNTAVWFSEIRKAIQKLPCGSNDAPIPYPSPVSVRKHQTTAKKSPDQKSAADSSNWLSPPSPDGPLSNASLLSKQGSKKTKLKRTKSTKVPFLGSTDDLTAASASPVERQLKLRDKLRNFFVRRPTVDALVKKGIWKDEPVFGCHLAALCAADESTVPKFVQQVIQLIESKAENMKADGIYRASGNLSQIQKIRCQVDQYNWAILEIEDDVHVLTGCLKLFFRELKAPLIPCELFERALQVTNIGAGSERTRKYREIMEQLPKENYDTLRYLFRHLLKITEFREHNRMHISNLAIVFGPTLMWAATASNNLALDMMQQNLVVEALLNNYHSIFVGR